MGILVITCTCMSLIAIDFVSFIDAPLSPSQKGYASMIQYLRLETAEDRQKAREEILATTEQDFKDFAHRLANVEKFGFSIVFGSQSALEQANEEINDLSKKFSIEPAIVSQ